MAGVRIGQGHTDRQAGRQGPLYHIFAGSGRIAALAVPAQRPREAGGRDTSAVSGSQDMEVSGPALCIWDEEVFTAPQGQRVEHYIADGDQVTTGDTIARDISRRRGQFHIGSTERPKGGYLPLPDIHPGR